MNFRLQLKLMLDISNLLLSVNFRLQLKLILILDISNFLLCMNVFYPSLRHLLDITLNLDNFIDRTLAFFKFPTNRSFPILLIL
jgi:hypothetical protein